LLIVCGPNAGHPWDEHDQRRLDAVDQKAGSHGTLHGK
jgi:hypothetical protein